MARPGITYFRAYARCASCKKRKRTCHRIISGKCASCQNNRIVCRPQAVESLSLPEIVEEGVNTALDTGRIARKLEGFLKITEKFVAEFQLIQKNLQELISLGNRSKAIFKEIRREGFAIGPDSDTESWFSANENAAQGENNSFYSQRESGGFSASRAEGNDFSAFLSGGNIGGGSGEGPDEWETMEIVDEDFEAIFGVSAENMLAEAWEEVETLN